ncbi:MAG: hypothetical protein OEY40_02255 [Candidatus Bathyarchaeota archaeon]|nr:hypothetical protein [Candidatus Bathyarchaeota archaeon]
MPLAVVLVVSDNNWKHKTFGESIGLHADAFICVSSNSKMVSELVQITEKRTQKIPSCRVDKELLLAIGNVIENSKRKGEKVYYNLKAKSRDIQSQNLKEFASEPPKDAEKISMRLSQSWLPSIEVEFDLEEEYFSIGHGEVSVSDPDSTWVHGTADRLIACFEKKRLGYRVISENGVIRAITSISLTIFLFSSFAYILFTLFSLNADEDVFSAFGLVALVFGICLDIGMKRLFPYFELESRSLPRKTRKIILGILIGSGLLPAIILKMLGL